MRYLCRVWGQGFTPSNEQIDAEAEKFTSTNLDKLLLSECIFSTPAGLTVQRSPQDNHRDLKSWIPQLNIPRKGSIPFSHKWLELLMSNCTGRRSNFGKTFTPDQAVTLINNLPDDHMTIPTTTLSTKFSTEILVSHSQWAVPTVTGWKFKAGKVLSAKTHIWTKISSPEVRSKIQDILANGWNPPANSLIQPHWFQDHPMSPSDKEAWNKEVITLLQMGSVSQITRSHVLKFGLPQVVLPIFLVHEKDKVRPIIDARFSNLPFLPPWFPLPDIQDFLGSLTRDHYWFKCDIKGGWHHIPIHQEHSNFFAFHWDNKLFQFNVCPFGDATAPYCFTYLLITLKRSLKAKGVTNFTLYIDDLLVPGFPDLHQTMKLRETTIKAQLELNLVLGAKKCPFPSKIGEALGFLVDTHLGIVTFSEEKLCKLQLLATSIKDTWDIKKKTPIRQLASLLGKIISGKILFHHTIGLLHKALQVLVSHTKDNQWDKHIWADPRNLQGIFEWINFVRSNPRRLWFHPAKTIFFSSDATLSTAAAAFWGWNAEYIPTLDKPTPLFTAQTSNIPESENIAAIEAFAILWGLEVLLPKVVTWLAKHQLQPKEVKWCWATDNQVCEASFHKGRSRELHVHEFSQQFLWKFILPLSLDITFPYIPSKINYWSDLVSRTSPAPYWVFNTAYLSTFLKFCIKHNLPVITADAFGSSKNKIVLKYHSKFLDIDSLPDFWSLKQSHDVLWVNPPILSIQQTITHILQHKLTAWVLLPFWPSQEWWKLTRWATSHFDVKYQPGLGHICLPSSPLVTNKFVEHWRICLFQPS